MVEKDGVPGNTSAKMGENNEKLLDLLMWRKRLRTLNERSSVLEISKR